MRFSDKQLQELSDYQSWKEGEDAGVTLLDYAAYTATPDQLFGYAAVFFRELIVFDGHHFFADAFDETRYARLKTQLPDGRAIQRVINELKMSTLLGNADIDDRAAKSCAELIAAAWNEVHGREGLVAEVHGATLEDLSVTLAHMHE